MRTFGGYARYYDLLYQDKNYASETKFVLELLKEHSSEARSILELGCGTGGHAECLAGEGYHIHGIDLSLDMLERAEKRRQTLPGHIRSQLVFEHGDIRSVRLKRKFDVVLSLFHVMSYQATNEDILAAFSIAKSHLKSGGLFIFDCWYGPGVLTNRPEVRVKRLNDEEISVLRIAEPFLYPNENVVDVDYQVIVTKLGTECSEEFKETHRMRYLFRPEVEQLMAQSGFKLLDSREWMTGQEPSFNSWSVCFVGECK